MKTWHMICDTCKQYGPSHEDPIEAVRLADAQGWSMIVAGGLTLNVCPSCKDDPEAALLKWRNAGKRLHATVTESAA